MVEALSRIMSPTARGITAGFTLSDGVAEITLSSCSIQDSTCNTNRFGMDSTDRDINRSDSILVDLFFNCANEDDLDVCGDDFINQIIQAGIYESKQLIDEFRHSLAYKANDKHVIAFALEVLSYCYNCTSNPGIINDIREFLGSNDPDKVFSAISVLPNLPNSVRCTFQLAISRIANDPDMPHDVRKAAEAEIVGYKRKKSAVNR